VLPEPKPHCHPACEKDFKQRRNRNAVVKSGIFIERNDFEKLLEENKISVSFQN
jgi:hypothetical protein